MSDEELNRYRATADFRDINDVEYPVKPMMQQPKPCQMHAVFSDAQEWAAYEAQRAVQRINIDTIKAEMIDEAEELRRKADRLLKLAGRL